MTGDIIPRTAPPVRKGLPPTRGTVDDSVISDLIFDTNSRETPQLARKTQTLNKSTPNLNKSSPNLSELSSFSPTPPIHHRDNFGSSVSSISSKTKSVGSLPSQSDADSQSLRDKSHSPFSDELSPSSGVPAIHLSPSATSNVFERPVSPSRPIPIDSSPSKSSRGGATSNSMKQGDMFAAVMDEYKDKSSTFSSSVSNVNGSPSAGRKKIHHYESIWDYPAADDHQKGKVDHPMTSTRQRHQSSRHEPQASTRVDIIDQPMSKYDQHLMKFDQFVSKQAQTRHDQRTGMHTLRQDQVMSRQDQQMSRHDQFTSRYDHPGSRHDQHVSRQDYPGSRHEQFISRQDLGMPHHSQDNTHRNAPLPSRTFSNAPQGHHQQLSQRYYTDNRMMQPNHGEVESSTLERRRRKLSQPEHVHAMHIKSNGYSPGRRINPPTIDENLPEILSSSYHHQGHIGGTTGTMVRSNTRLEPSGRYDPWDYSASLLPYGMQHPRQRSEPEHLFESAKSDIVDFKHHGNLSNNAYNFHEQNSYNFHDPGTFEEGTLV